MGSRPYPLRVHLPQVIGASRGFAPSYSLHESGNWGLLRRPTFSKISPFCAGGFLGPKIRYTKLCTENVKLQVISRKEVEPAAKFYLQNFTRRNNGGKQYLPRDAPVATVISTAFGCLNSIRRTVPRTNSPRGDRKVPKIKKRYSDSVPELERKQRRAVGSLGQPEWPLRKDFTVF